MNRAARRLAGWLLLCATWWAATAHADDLVQLKRAPELRQAAFDFSAGALWDDDALVLVKSSLESYREAPPFAFPRHVSVLGHTWGNVWLRAGSLFVHYQSNPRGWTHGTWRKREIPPPDGVVYDDARMRQTIDGWLIIEQTPDGFPVLLRPSGDTLQVAPYTEQQADAPVAQQPYYQAIAPDGECLLIHRPKSGDPEETELPDLATENGKCAITVASENGSLWIAHKDWLAVRGNDRWLFLSHLPLRLKRTRRGLHWRVPAGTGAALLGVTSIGVDIAGATFLTRESTYYRSTLRVTAATVAALPISALYLSALDMRGEREVHPLMLAPLIVISAPLPALGAWGVGRLADDGARHPGAGFAGALAGTALVLLVSTPLHRLAKRDRGSDGWLAVVLATAITGFTTSVGYSLAASLPR